MKSYAQSFCLKIAIFACLIVNCTCQNQTVVKPLLLFDGKMVGISNLFS